MKNSSKWKLYLKVHTCLHHYSRSHLSGRAALRSTSRPAQSAARCRLIPSLNARVLCATLLLQLSNPTPPLQNHTQKAYMYFCILLREPS